MAKTTSKPKKIKVEEGEKKLTRKPSKKDSEQEEEGRLKPKDDEEEKEEGQSSAPADFLRQYQYKKVNGNPMVGGPLTDPDPGSKAAVMKAFLLAQERVSIFIPRVEGENPRVTLSVNLNGYRLDLPKQTYLQLPKQIAEVIMESQKQQVQALQPYLINRDEKTAEALS